GPQQQHAAGIHRRGLQPRDHVLGELLDLLRRGDGGRVEFLLGLFGPGGGIGQHLVAALFEEPVAHLVGEHGGQQYQCERAHGHGGGRHPQPQRVPPVAHAGACIPPDAAAQAAQPPPQACPLCGCPGPPPFAAAGRSVHDAGVPARYPTPRTVTTTSGFSGSFSTFARRRCTCTFTRRVSAWCRYPQTCSSSTSRVNTCHGLRARATSRSNSNGVRLISSSPRSTRWPGTSMVRSPMGSCSEPCVLRPRRRALTRATSSVGLAGLTT